jgi:hypothetical protein
MICLSHTSEGSHLVLDQKSPSAAIPLDLIALLRSKMSEHREMFKSVAQTVGPSFVKTVGLLQEVLQQGGSSCFSATAAVPLARNSSPQNSWTSGDELARLCDAAVVVPSVVAARTQEIQIFVGRAWCEALEHSLRLV